MLRNRKSRALLLLAPACLVLLQLACKTDPDAVTAEQAAQVTSKALEARKVRLITPEQQVERPVLELVGEVRAFETVNVPAEAAGRVDRVLVEVGDRVAAGAPLVEVDRETYRLRLNQAAAEMAAAKADLELATKELDRKRDLVSDETIAQAVFDQASARHDQAEARLAAVTAAFKLASRDHERSLVKAISGGSIAARLVSAGSWADVGQTLLTLAVGDTVKVAARVPEGWVTRISGLESFEFQAGGSGSKRAAELFSIDPVLEGSSRSFEVVGTADNHEGALHPGMFATVFLTSPNERRSLWLPVAAVVISDLPQVLLARDGKVADRSVQTGRRDGDLIEIVTGVEPDDQLIAEVAGLTRGLPVTVVND